MRTYNSPLTEVNMMEAALSMMNVSGGVGNVKMHGISDYDPEKNSWEYAR